MTTHPDRHGRGERALALGGARDVVVWGNCQAVPMASLLKPALEPRGFTVVEVDPVYLLDDAGVAAVHHRMASTAVLVSQPVREEYHVAGCSTEHLAALLPDGAQVVRFPVTYYSGDLPFQITISDADGVRVLAPLTDYHDLRLLAAAARGEKAADVLGRPPLQVDPQVLDAHAASSVEELQRREDGLDVRASDLVADGAGDRTMFTVDHPANRVLVELARRVLDILGLPDARHDVPEPEREFLGAIRTPLTRSTDRALGAGWGDSSWVIGGREVAWDEVVRTHLAWYADRPDLVQRGVERHGDRLTAFGLRG